MYTYSVKLSMSLAVMTQPYLTSAPSAGILSVNSVVMMQSMTFVIEISNLCL